MYVSRSFYISMARSYSYIAAICSNDSNMRSLNSGSLTGASGSRADGWNWSGLAENALTGDRGRLGWICGCSRFSLTKTLRNIKHIKQPNLGRS